MHGFHRSIFKKYLFIINSESHHYSRSSDKTLAFFCSFNSHLCFCLSLTLSQWIYIRFPSPLPVSDGVRHWFRRGGGGLPWKGLPAPDQGLPGDGGPHRPARVLLLQRGVLPQAGAAEESPPAHHGPAGADVPQEAGAQGRTRRGQHTTRVSTVRTKLIWGACDWCKMESSDQSHVLLLFIQTYTGRTQECVYC